MTMGTQMGSTPITGSNTDYMYPDVIAVTSDVGATRFTALGVAGAEIKFLDLLLSDGSLGTRLTQAATPSAGKFMYTPGTKAINFFAGDVVSGTNVFGSYNATTGASTKTITSKVNLFAKNVKVVIDGLVRDTCTGLDYKAQIIFFKAKASNKFDFTLTADGQPAVQNLELEALKSCGSDDLVKMIVFDDDETV